MSPGKAWPTEIAEGAQELSRIVGIQFEHAILTLYTKRAGNERGTLIDPHTDDMPTGKRGRWAALTIAVRGKRELRFHDGGRIVTFQLRPPDIHIMTGNPLHSVAGGGSQGSEVSLTLRGALMEIEKDKKEEGLKAAHAAGTGTDEAATAAKEKKKSGKKAADSLAKNNLQSDQKGKASTSTLK